MIAIEEKSKLLDEKRYLCMTGWMPWRASWMPWMAG